jgi:hypothetical protein
MSGTGRPWWVPLLGVGSIGLGGFQALGGIAMAWVAAEVGGSSGNVFFGLAAAWFLPGILLAISGLGVVMGARWGRSASLAAVALMVLSLAFVAAERRAIPGAIADAWEHGERAGPAPVVDLLRKSRKTGSMDAMETLRDPDLGEGSSWMFTLECGCGLPWYLVVLAACGLPSGRRIATR